MKAMIFAAGRGERMRHLTDATPKPLLKLAGKPLIEYGLENLAKAGFKDVVINIAYLGGQIKNFCGDGSRWNLSIVYSDEGETALETAGGIVKALPLLGDEPFLAINSDILCDYPLAALRDKALDLVHLVMIPNPLHHPQGDFHLESNGLLSVQGEMKLTFSGIGIYRPALFVGIPAGPMKLRPLFERAISERQASGELFDGRWVDIGSPERLAEVERSFSCAGV